MPDGREATGAWSISIDRDACMGSGVCVAYAGGTFSQDGDGKVVVLELPSDGLDEVRAAAEGCPTASIALTIGGGDR